MRIADGITARVFALLSELAINALETGAECISDTVTGEVRFLGHVENSPLPIERTIKRLANRYDRLHVCFEAGPG